jgi:hypothetical protein
MMFHKQTVWSYLQDTSETQVLDTVVNKPLKEE